MRERTGARIHLGARAQAEYGFAPAVDRSSLALGSGVRIDVLETPGHSPESISLAVYDLTRDRAYPHAVLTGDTLFVGDVGRPAASMLLRDGRADVSDVAGGVAAWEAAGETEPRAQP